MTQMFIINTLQVAHRYRMCFAKFSTDLCSARATAVLYNHVLLDHAIKTLDGILFASHLSIMIIWPTYSCDKICMHL